MRTHRVRGVLSLVCALTAAGSRLRSGGLNPEASSLALARAAMRRSQYFAGAAARGVAARLGSARGRVRTARLTAADWLWQTGGAGRPARPFSPPPPRLASWNRPPPEGGPAGSAPRVARLGPARSLLRSAPASRWPRGPFSSDFPPAGQKSTPFARTRLSLVRDARVKFSCIFSYENYAPPL